MDDTGTTRRRFCVAGLGRLGSSFLNLRPAQLEEFDLCAGFDVNANRVEFLQSEAPLYPAYKMGEVIARFAIELALLCVPPEAAQETAEKLAAAGIRGIINFSPVTLTLPPEVAVQNLSIAGALRSLTAPPAP